jgi:cytoplasmic iron level regulating protein YaaA (DUF328/UPF0246 family)
MAAKNVGPLILLSPAKSLNFEGPLSATFEKLSPTVAPLLSSVRPLTTALAKLSKAQVKSLMGLSDSLASLNHERYSNFEAQPVRMALAAFEGQAYKGLDAASLEPESLDYCQSHLRILCGLYGILRPYDEIRPYRLEMSTKLECPGGASNLYAYWGDSLTDAINAEAPKWVLNVASMEYAKAVEMKKLACPVVTAVFPGPAVYAKTARGEMVRFCAEQGVTKPESLRTFRGGNGAWSYVPEASDESTYVFHRGAAGAGGGGGAAGKKAKATKRAKEADSAVVEQPGGGRRQRKK